MDRWRMAEAADESLSPYAGRWVALLDGEVIAQGGTPDQAYQYAKKSRFRENPELVYVPMKTKLLQSEIYTKIRQAIPANVEIYAVGGAIRDAVLGIDSHDIDFTVAENALSIARRVADQLKGAYFPLDTERGIGRVILNEDDTRTILDFTLFRGGSLEEDLRHRDFTINAIAVRLDDQQTVYDPLGGITDLNKKRLVACMPTSLEDDPIRILRAIRFAATLGLKIDPETRKKMRSQASLTSWITPERLRDEIFRILESGKTSLCFRTMEVMNILQHIFPELTRCSGVQQTAPHIHDVWNHTLEVIKHLETILALLQPEYDPSLAENAALGYLQLRLGRYREQITSHLIQSVVPERDIKSLLLMAALYHDTGKPETAFQDEDGRIRFFGHEDRGRDLIGKKARDLMLSNTEVQRLETIVGHHMRPAGLSRETILPSRRAVYRFYRDTGESGVDICLLSIADLLAAYGPTIPQDRWERHLDVMRIMLDAWWEKPHEQVYPDPLIDGNELMDFLDILPGPVVGELLEGVIEAQVSGEISTREAALEYARDLLKHKTNQED